MKFILLGLNSWNMNYKKKKNRDNVYKKKIQIQILEFLSKILPKSKSKFRI